jgi:hypothetical protein
MTRARKLKAGKPCASHVGRRVVIKPTEIDRVGAKVTIERNSRHPRAVLHYGGRSQFIVLNGSPSDGRAHRSAALDARRTLRRLGAAI